jgi:hypothetical protein
MRSSEDALEKFVKWRSFQIPLIWTFFPRASDSTDSRVIRAEIAFVDRDRGYVRIWASDKFMRSFSISECEIGVSESGVDMICRGERYLLVEESPQA